MKVKKGNKKERESERGRVWIVDMIKKENKGQSCKIPINQTLLYFCFCFY